MHGDQILTLLYTIAFDCIHKYCSYVVVHFFPSQNVDLSLSLRVPLLADASDACKAVFMDTPGFGDAMRKRTAQIAQESLESSCAYLFVINYEQMQDSGDTAILEYLHSIDQCKLASAALCLVIFMSQ